MGFEDMFGGNEPNDPSAAPPAEAPAPEAPPAAAAAPEAPPAEAPAPEASPPAAATPEAPPASPPVAQPHDQIVSALTEERARRREIQEQLNQTNARFNELLMRLQQSQQPQSQAPQIPSYDEDPAGHLRGMQQHYEQQLAELRQQVAGQNQRTQVVDQHTQFAHAVAAHEAEFSARTPDYHTAVAFVQQRKLTEYRAVGLNEVEARQALARDTMSVAQLAAQRGQNPAEVMYGVAKAMGYTGTPAAPGAQVQRPAAPSSLSSAGGAPGADNTGAPTPEALANMSDSEFDAWWNKMAATSGNRAPQ